MQFLIAAVVILVIAVVMMVSWIASLRREIQTRKMGLECYKFVQVVRDFYHGFGRVPIDADELDRFLQHAWAVAPVRELLARCNAHGRPVGMYVNRKMRPRFVYTYKVTPRNPYRGMIGSDFVITVFDWHGYPVGEHAARVSDIEPHAMGREWYDLYLEHERRHGRA